MVTRGLLSFVRWDLFEFGPEAWLWRAPCAGECAGDRTVPSRPWWLAGLTATSPNGPSCIFQDCPFFGDDQAVWRASDHPLLDDLSGNRIPKRTMRSLVYVVLGMSRGNLKSPSDAGAFFPRGTCQPKSLGLEGEVSLTAWRDGQPTPWNSLGTHQLPAGDSRGSGNQLCGDPATSGWLSSGDGEKTGQ